jgi:hypothetical protein
MRVLQSHKRGEVKGSGVGLEIGGQTALQVSERPLPREDIQNKSCGVYSCVYVARESVW